MDTKERKRFLNSLLFPSLFVALLWIIKGIELANDIKFTQYGVLPRDLKGLRGIIFSPLIHGDLKHLFNNTVPLLVLGSTLFYFYKEVAPKLVIWSYLLAGLYTWISARTSYHIGASGLVYALFGFLFISGFIRKYIPLIAISFLVAFLYGSLVWGILPFDESTSFEGHFWGLIVGVIFAIYYRKIGPQPKKYSWELEEEKLGEEEEKIEENNLPMNNYDKEDEVNIVYHFVPKKKPNQDQ